MDPIRSLSLEHTLIDARKMRERARQVDGYAEAAVARAKAMVQTLRSQDDLERYRKRLRDDHNAFRP